MSTDRSDDITRVSLLMQLHTQQPDPDTWVQFVRRSGPMLYRWCRTWHLQEAEIEDVTQEVLVKLSRRLQEFRYDRNQSFRAYLKTLAHFACCDLLAESKGAAGTGDSRVLDQLNNLEARDDL